MRAHHQPRGASCPSRARASRRLRQPAARLCATLGAILAALARIAVAGAAEVGATGALDVTATGFAAFEAYGGDVDDQRLDPELGNGPDFVTDTELHVLARARDEHTGLDYGAQIEFEADTDIEENTGKAWLFVRGRLGELRLGAEDGAVKESALGADTIAAGTGGIDGNIVDALAVGVVSPTDTEVATKVRYYTPSVAGFQLGVSYTPRAALDVGSGSEEDEAQDWFEAALAYEGELDPIDLQASIVGAVGRVTAGEAATASGRLAAVYAGAVLGIDPVELAGGIGTERVGGRDRTYANLGVAGELDAFSVSLTGGRVLDTSGHDGIGRPWNIALSASLPLVPGLELQGDLARFDNDVDRDAEGVGGGRGWVWVTRLELTF